MSATGNYLYGFTDARFSPEGELRGLANAPVRLVGFRDVAAVISDHPVQRLIPLRANLEPHHRIIGHISSRGALVPAAFGHISESEADILSLLQENYCGIRQELERLSQKTEMGLKLLWNVPNIFEYFIGLDRELRELRDRVFRKSRRSLEEKLQVGSLFEARLNSERERLTEILLNAMQPVTFDAVTNPPRDEKVVCDAALLVDGGRLNDFVEALRGAAGLFDPNFLLDYSGPRVPYSFVRLRLQAGACAAPEVRHDAD